MLEWYYKYRESAEADAQEHPLGARDEVQLCSLGPGRLSESSRSIPLVGHREFCVALLNGDPGNDNKEAAEYGEVRLARVDLPSERMNINDAPHALTRCAA
jgi:hypothetical protein